MSVSSAEVRHADFPRSLRGYDPVVVRRFLSELADVLVDLNQRSARLHLLEEANARDVEATRAKEAKADEQLRLAHLAAQAVLESAERESQAAIVAARLEAIGITEEARLENDHLRKNVLALRAAYQELSESYETLLRVSERTVIDRVLSPGGRAMQVQPDRQSV